mmetsp:Transcript_74534/g.129244  ORF Transcript_74534/g.129244 Transcript_74534/m.129244 type:complete len:666 (+) Transcript_74534:42-2039(+)
MLPIIWKVVGGGDKGGILVRTGHETASPEATSRLRTGSLVLEQKLMGERLMYARLTGAGPDVGWVSVTLKGKDLVVKESLDGLVWEVVGGGDKGGIVVRQGQDTASPELPTRLSTGAILKQAKLVGDRLQYERLLGTGPDTGWVSTVFKGKPLVEKKDLSAMLSVVPSAGPSSLPAGSAAPDSGRKARILCLHATPSNTNIMSFQTTALRQAAGTDIEWLFVDGPNLWEPTPGSTYPDEMERSQFEKVLAKGSEFWMWYRTVSRGTAMNSDTFEDVDLCCQFLSEYIESQKPIDAVVTFSQASSMISMFVEDLRRRGQEPPWRLTVQFNGGSITDARYAFPSKSAHPIIYVAGVKDDFYFLKDHVAAMYESVLLLEHDDGHSFPQTQPKAKEVYDRLVAELRRHCGLPAEIPGVKKAPATKKAAPKAPAAKEATAPAKKVEEKEKKEWWKMGEGEELPPGKWTVDYLGEARGKCKKCNCEWYRWNPNKLRPERGDDGDATITEWFLNDYSSLACQVCKCPYQSHVGLGHLLKPAGFTWDTDATDVDALINAKAREPGSPFDEESGKKKAAAIADIPEGAFFLAEECDYEVVHAKVVVRSVPETGGEMKGLMKKGDKVCGPAYQISNNPWLLVSEKSCTEMNIVFGSAWMLIDGKSVGLGELLKKL